MFTVFWSGYCWVSGVLYWHHPTCLIWSVLAVPRNLNNLTLTHAGPQILTSRFVLTMSAQSTCCTIWELVPLIFIYCWTYSIPTLNTYASPYLYVKIFRTWYRMSDAREELNLGQMKCVLYFAVVIELRALWVSQKRTISFCKLITRTCTQMPLHTFSSLTSYNTIYSRHLKCSQYFDEAL